MPKPETTPPRIISRPAIAMPRWKAEVAASEAADWTRCAGPGGSRRVAGTESGSSFACDTACPAAGPRGRSPRLESMLEPNWAEMTTPSTAIASRPATRAIPLLAPEAMPTWRSSTESSTVAVSGATVAARPRLKTSTPGSTSAR